MILMPRHCSQRAGTLLACALLGLVTLSLSLGLASRAQAAGSGSIRGRVTNGSAAPIKGIEVCANEAGSEGSPGPGLFGVCAATNLEGEYTLSGLTGGEYTVEFLSPPSSGLDYIAQYYQGKSSASEANRVTVIEEIATTGIDAQLSEGGRIAGRVTSASTGAPLDEVLVCALPPHAEAEMGPLGACAQTNAAGEYTLSALPAGEYSVGFLASFFRELNYATQYYQGKVWPGEANPVPVRVGETTQAIDAALVEGGVITGTVTSAATGAGLENVFVCALSVAHANALAGCTFSEAHGAYTLRALPAGEYKVRFSGSAAYLREYYNDQFTLGEAQVVSVSAGAVAAGISVAMELGPASAPKNLAPPSIAGIATIGSSLSCGNGSWKAAPAPRFSYGWLRDGTAIAGANASTYSVTGDDEGHTIACEVTATNYLGKLSSASAGVLIATVPPPTPSIAVSASRVRVSGRLLSVRVLCSAASCQGTAELTIQIVVKHRHKGKTLARRSTLVLAKGSFSLVAGQTGTVVLHLTPLGRVKLAHAKRHPLMARLSLSIKGGATVVKRVLTS